MSNTSKTMKWTSKFKPKHLTVGTQVQLRNGTVTTIKTVDEDGLITRGSCGCGDMCHRANGEHFYGVSEHDIVRVSKASKDKTLDLRKAVVGSRITFSNGQKAVVYFVDLDGSDSTFIGHDSPDVKDGWHLNTNGKRESDESAPRIIKLKPPKKDAE